jgi:beta-glucanase (GH16 family)
MPPTAPAPARPVRLMLTVLGVVATVAAVVAAGVAALPGTAQAAPRTIFADGFDGLDRDRWRAADHAADVNAELQYYTPANVNARGGVLRLRAQRRAAGGRRYTSGLVSTAGRFSFTYGTVTWRAWVPRGKGLWPALWLLGNGCAGSFQRGTQRCPSWPAPGSEEVDVLEYRGSRPRQIHMAYHHNTRPGRTAGMDCQWNGGNYAAGWHTFSIEWAPGRLIWRIDGIERCRTARNVPRTPMFLVMNLAVGGFFDGNPTRAARLPQDFRIDWVRITRP